MEGGERETGPVREGGKRVELLWMTLRRLPESLRIRVFLELLEGCEDDDIWLWMDGDEHC